MTSADIDCVSCSANGSVCEDRNEAHGIAAALDECVTTLPVEAIKSVRRCCPPCSADRESASSISSSLLWQIPQGPLSLDSVTHFSMRYAHAWLISLSLT